MKVRVMRVVFFLVSSLALIAACSATGGNTSGSSSGNTGGSASGAGGDATTISVGVTVGAGGGCASTCSGDLKQVIDCNGVVTQTCGLDEACLDGDCSDKPCDAAAAAKGSIGCDYWALKPDVITGVGAEGACFAAFIANTWDTPVKIEASRNGQSFNNFIRIPQGQGQNLTYGNYDPTVGLGVGEVAILFLADQKNMSLLLPACPGPAGFNGNPGILGTGRGQAINITTDRPVVAYTIFPYGGGAAAATSATLLLPTPAWDTNYVAVNAYAKSTIVPQAVPSLAVLARENNTTVTFLPKVAIDGGLGVSPAPANTQATYTLNAGEYVQISQQQELTGSPIQSDKPIALWGAASCLNVPVGAAACDSAHQQIPPVKALGYEYIGVRYRNRATAMGGEETPPWRLVGAVDGTVLTWSPSTPPGAPTTLASGQVVEFMASGPLSVKSQDSDHPFYFAQYMTGCLHVLSTVGEGDPEWVNVVPPQQYLKRYVFFTDPTYAETSLVVVRQRDAGTNAFVDVELDCAGTLTGWQVVGDYEYTRIDLVTGNFQNVGSCSNGRHQMSSAAPFGVTVWGWGTNGTSPATGAVSYAYPAGAGIKSINDIVVPATPK
ncbi:MAG: IgGFc-binding protein [Polyangiaceae bacterium]